MTGVSSLFVQARKTLLLASLLVLFVMPLQATYAAEEVLNPACKDTPESTLCKEATKQQTPSNNSIYGPNGILTRVVRIISLIVGIASVFVIIIAGLRYITASGDPNSVNGAKNTILYAVIGLVVASVAQVMIIFVLSRL